MRYILIFLVSWVVGACSKSNPVSPMPPDKGIMGKIIGPTGKPIKGAVVTANKVIPGLAKKSAADDSTITDDAGNFHLEVVAGTYDVRSELNSGNLVAFTPNVEVGDTVVPLTDTIKTPGKVHAKLSIPGFAKRSAKISASDLTQGSCFISRVTPVYRSDDSGVCEIPSIPEGKHKIILEFPRYMAVSESVEVMSGNTASVSKILQADPGYSPPTPVLRTASFNNLTGIVSLEWSSIKVADLVGYSVYRNIEGETTPNKLNKGVISDTIFSDSVFMGLNMDSVVLEYRVKSQDTGLNVSDNFSNKLRIVAYNPRIFKTFINFDYPQKISINDTIRIIGSFKNATKRNEKVSWFVNEDSLFERNIKSDSDTLVLIFDSTQIVRIGCRVLDSDGFLWMDSIDIKIDVYGPTVVFENKIERNLEAFKSTTYHVNADDEVGKIIEYAWDFEGDGIYDSTTTIPQITFSPAKSSGTLVVKVRDDDNNVALDSVKYTTFGLTGL